MVLAKLHYIRIKYNKHDISFFQARVKDSYYQNNYEKAFNMTSKYIFSVVQSELCYYMWEGTGHLPKGMPIRPYDVHILHEC